MASSSKFPVWALWRNSRIPDLFNHEPNCFYSQMSAHHGHHQLGIFKTSLPSRLPGSDEEGTEETAVLGPLQGCGACRARQLCAQPRLAGRARGSRVLPVCFSDKRPVREVLPRGSGGTSLCSQSPWLGEFKLSFQGMIHLGQRMLPFPSSPCDEG